ncbi:MAG: MBL fold hydrolase [Chlamydiae bacterium CG10_big_fil_rev_8_21_14_0_10_35_9]|nr:MAG: MBL fold hydrolase [Chlamydiae bacterium CG10_big_fil_rev_8_21_14_0_10_35_9]
MILEVFKTGPLDTNAIVIACKETGIAAIFDAPFGSCEAIIDLCKEKSLKAQAIYLTHSHWDHIGNCLLLKKSLQVPVYVHEKDAENLTNPGVDGVPMIAPVQGMAPDGFLQDNEKIDIGKLSFTILHTPGHSPGSVCFYEKNREVLISGDTLFKGSFGNVSFPSSNRFDMIESLKKLAKLPENTKVYPGHGEPTFIGKEKWLADAHKYLT